MPSPSQQKPPTLDLTALHVNQVSIIVLLIAAFVLNLPLLVAAIFAVMALGTLTARPGFLPVYRYILKPARLARPHIIADHPQPHRFAQGVGAGFLAASSLLLISGSALPGWVLSWVVIALAAVNLFTGFCLGCAMFYWLQRLGIPGFTPAALHTQATED